MINLKEKTGTIFCSFVLLVLVFLSYHARQIEPTLLLDLDPQPDAPEYAITAQNLLAKGSFNICINNHEVPSRYGVGYPLLISVFYLIFGNDYVHAVYASLCSSLFLILLVFITTSLLYKKWIGLTAAAIIAISDLDIFVSQQIMSESFSTTCLFLSLGFLLFAGKQTTQSGEFPCRPLFLSGLLFGISTLVRVNNLVFIIAHLVFIFIALESWHILKEYRRLLKHLSCFLLGFSPPFILLLYLNFKIFGGIFKTSYRFWFYVLGEPELPFFGFNYAEKPPDKWLHYLLALLGFPGQTMYGDNLSLYPYFAAGLAIVLLIAVLSFKIWKKEAKSQLQKNEPTQGMINKDGIGTIFSLAYALSFITILLTTYFTFTFYFWKPDLRFFHTIVPFVSLLAGGGIWIIVRFIEIKFPPWRGIKGTLIIVLLSIIPFWSCVKLSTSAFQSKHKPAPLNYTRMQYLNQKIEKNALIVSDEFEPVYFSAFNCYTSNREIMRLKKTAFQFPDGFRVENFQTNPDYLKKSIRKGRPAYFIGHWKNGEKDFVNLPGTELYRLEKVDDVIVNKYVSAPIYRIFNKDQ